MRSLQIAAGEAEEVRYFLILSRDLNYMAVPCFEEASQMCDSVAQLISALGRSLRSRGLKKFTSYESRVTGHD